VRDALISNAEPYTGVDDGCEDTRKLLGAGVPFTAIFASNDTMAVGAMRYLKEKNLTVRAMCQLLVLTILKYAFK